MVSPGDSSRWVEASEEILRLLARAAREGDVVLTRGGQPVGRLTAERERTQEQIDAAIRDIEGFAAGHSLGGLSWKDLRDDGRKR